tara:strand:+ start:92 stop:202 length:111 start_codon:yes stop_codon:yes gene_type:complete
MPKILIICYFWLFCWCFLAISGGKGMIVADFLDNLP